MSERVRIQIAALVTALFLGAVVSATTLTHPPSARATAARPASTARTLPRPSPLPQTSELQSYD